MKFKYTGFVPIRNVTLELAGIIPTGTVIKTNDEIEIDDERTDIIERMKVSKDYTIIKTKTSSKKK